MEFSAFYKNIHSVLTRIDQGEAITLTRDRKPDLIIQKAKERKVKTSKKADPFEGMPAFDIEDELKRSMNDRAVESGGTDGSE